MTRFRILAVTSFLVVHLFVNLLSEAPGQRPSTSNGNGHFSFALIGDMPYGPEGDRAFPHVIADVNADKALSFVVHDGDFKNGSSLCSDAVFQNRLTPGRRPASTCSGTPRPWPGCTSRSPSRRPAGTGPRQAGRPRAR